MELNYDFQRRMGRGVRDNPFSGVGMNIFWNCILEHNVRVAKGKKIHITLHRFQFLNDDYRKLKLLSYLAYHIHDQETVAVQAYSHFTP